MIGVACAAASWLHLVPDSFQQVVGQCLDVGFSADEMFHSLQVDNGASLHIHGPRSLQCS